MRKIFATLLAVVMVACVFAAMPASAAVFDNSTAADAQALTLVATEIMPNPDGRDTYEFIEFYNRSDAAVDFYGLSLVRSPLYQNDPSLTSDNDFYATRNMWRTTHKFQAKMDITTGDLVIPAEAQTLAPQGVSFTNPASGSVAARSIALVWFVNQDALRDISEKAATDYDPSEIPADLARIMFREKFNVPNAVPIFMVWGDNAVNADHTIKNNEFALSNCINKYEAYMLGLVENTFDLDTDTGSSAKVKCLFSYGANQVMYFKGEQSAGKAYTFVPADQTPDVVNRKVKPKKTNEEASDFVWGGYVESYRQVGMAGGVETPTPGTMEKYQWYYVDAAHAPMTVSAADVQEWADRVAPAGDIDTGYVDDTEPTDINPQDNLESREDKEARLLGGTKTSSGSKKNTGKTGDGTDAAGLPTGALIGIIAGGVVILAAAAVAVIIVMKKKKAAPAVEEAPAEEAPAEEAPAEEENKEE